MLGFFAVACGGSASETPPPLEPDLSRAAPGAPQSGRYVVITSRKKPEQGETAPIEGEEAPATWGR